MKIEYSIFGYIYLSWKKFGVDCVYLRCVCIAFESLYFALVRFSKKFEFESQE